MSRYTKGAKNAEKEIYQYYHTADVAAIIDKHTQAPAMLALLERWMKLFPEPDMGRATYNSWKQQDVIDDTKALLKEAKEMKDGAK